MRHKLKIENPAFAAEWDFDKNIGLNIDDYTGGSNKYVWWRCAKHGHSWYAQINKRFSRNQGCRICNNHEVLAGFNDITTTHPHLAAEWNREKNGDKLSEHYTKGADVRVWWKCAKCGYEWECVIYSRTSGSPTGCPCCAGNVLIVGKNDLQTINPALAKQLDIAKNKGLRACDIAANDNRKVWWIDKLGHSWKASVASRNSGRGCPYCANRLLLRGFNDLATRNPVLADEWDDEENKPLTARDVIYGSHDYAWWKCKLGHSWRAQISNRASGTGCPYCEHKVVSPGETDLATVRPDIADAWNYEQNYPLTPDRIAAWSSQYVWWFCDKCGLSYNTAIASRRSADSCPYCHGKRPIPGKTDFASVHPELLGEWDFDQNVLPPTAYTYGSDKSVWWHCEKGHSWQAMIYDRHKGGLCPYCSGTWVIPGETDAATISPELEMEWDRTRNEGYDLRNLKRFCNTKFWWKCRRCHRHWQSTLGARTAGSQCPWCNGKVQVRTRLVM